MRSVSAYLRGNVLGLVAIFLALNAGAYAAVTTNNDLATGSVDTRVLAQGAVEGPDIHSAAVGPKKIKLDKLVKFLQTRVSGSCPQGESVQGILADGSVLCAPGAAGTINGVTTSGGLTGGGSSGTVDIGVDPAVLQSRITGSCSGNDAVQSVAEDGSVACDDFVTGVIAGSGLSGGTITDTGTISVDPAATQSRVTGGCTGTQAVQSVAQNGSVNCSPSLATAGNVPHSGYVQLNDDPSQSATLLNFGGMVLRATCSPGGNAKVEIGSNGGPGQFVNYQVNSTTNPNLGSTVDNGNFATITDTATNERGDFNAMTSSLGQIDGSYLAWGIATTGGIDCVFHASALAF